MFNAPRQPNGPPISSSSFVSPSSSSTYADPLAQSTPNPGFEVDPWSAVPSPARTGTPRTDEVTRADAFDGKRLLKAGLM